MLFFFLIMLNFISLIIYCWQANFSGKWTQAVCAPCVGYIREITKWTHGFRQVDACRQIDSVCANCAQFQPTGLSLIQRIDSVSGKCTQEVRQLDSVSGKCAQLGVRPLSFLPREVDSVYLKIVFAGELLVKNKQVDSDFTSKYLYGRGG